MKKKVSALIVLGALLVLCVSSVNADSGGYTKPDCLNSKGYIEFDTDNDPLTTDDKVIFDAQDIYYLYYMAQ